MRADHGHWNEWPLELLECENERETRSDASGTFEPDGGQPPSNELSDGIPLIPDWTPVHINRISLTVGVTPEALATYGNDGTRLPPSTSPNERTADPTVVEIDLSGLNDRVEQHTSADRLLSAHEFTALVTSLIDGDAAVEYDTLPSSYARYTFTDDLHLAQSYFDPWIAAAANKAVNATRQPEPTEISLVAALPPGTHPVARRAIDRTALKIQTLLNRADDVAHIAAPYFDPDEHVVETTLHFPSGASKPASSHGRQDRQTEIPIHGSLSNGFVRTCPPRLKSYSRYETSTRRVLTDRKKQSILKP